MPAGSFAIIDERTAATVGVNGDVKLDVVCLQDEAHIGFMSMIDSVMSTAQLHLDLVLAG